MSYAQHRKIIDADSHVIELDDFLHAAAKAEHKDLIPLMSAQSELPVVEAGLNRGRELFEKRKKDPQIMAQTRAIIRGQFDVLHKQMMQDFEKYMGQYH